MSYLPAPPPRFVYRLGGWIHSLVVRLAQRLTPAPIALYEQLTGVWMTQMLYAMTRLELVEALAAAPRSDEELAALAGVERDTLARLLRALVAVGLLARGRDRRYRLTRLSEPLRKDAPDSMRDITLYGGSLHSMHAWSRFADVVRTGRDGYELAHGRSLFDYL
ncbi:MAG TPA: methyltransferase dimerization domain-containing protein, partial [Polyangia bacterium]